MGPQKYINDFNIDHWTFDFSEVLYCNKFPLDLLQLGTQAIIVNFPTLILFDIFLVDFIRTNVFFNRGVLKHGFLPGQLKYTY